ncbi:hypothetical protein D3C75_1131520 [compost metagenome]
MRRETNQLLHHLLFLLKLLDKIRGTTALIQFIIVMRHTMKTGIAAFFYKPLDHLFVRI